MIRTFHVPDLRENLAHDKIIIGVPIQKRKSEIVIILILISLTLVALLGCLKETRVIVQIHSNLSIIL